LIFEAFVRTSGGKINISKSSTFYVCYKKTRDKKILLKVYHGLKKSVEYLSITVRDVEVGVNSEALNYVTFEELVAEGIKG